MKKTLLIGLTVSSLSVSAQSVSPDVISSAGNHFENASMQVSWTLGEPVIQTVSDGTTQLTQGFHQTYLSSVAIHEIDENIVFNAFPNPVLNQLMIEVSEAEIGSTLQLIDSKGRVILEQLLDAKSTTLDFSTYGLGMYYLNLISQSKEIAKTFKIQKISK